MWETARAGKHFIILANKSWKGHFGHWSFLTIFCDGLTSSPASAVPLGCMYQAIMYDTNIIVSPFLF
jgi:hypothetical protein